MYLIYDVDNVWVDMYSIFLTPSQVYFLSVFIVHSDTIISSSTVAVDHMHTCVSVTRFLCVTQHHFWTLTSSSINREFWR